MHTSFRVLALLVLSIGLMQTPAQAQDTAPDPGLVIELNKAQSTTDGCSLSFLITNGLAERIDALVLEVVLFDTNGQVERLTLFDFGVLPANRPRVRQFVVPDRACGDYASILINGVQTCEVAGAASGVCGDALELSARGDIDLIG